MKNKNIYGKFAAATAEMFFDKTGKDYRGTKGGNHSLDDILPVVKTILFKHGLTHTYSQIENEKSITSRIEIFDCETDASFKVDMIIPKTAYLNVPKNKSGMPLMTEPQWCGAINSYFKRYTYVNAFGVSEGDLVLDTGAYDNNGYFVNGQDTQQNYQQQNYQQQNTYQQQDTYQQQVQTDFVPQQAPIFNVQENEKIEQSDFLNGWGNNDPIPFEAPQTQMQNDFLDIEIQEPKIEMSKSSDLEQTAEKVVSSYQNVNNTFDLTDATIKKYISLIKKEINDKKLTETKITKMVNTHNNKIKEGEKL